MNPRHLKFCLNYLQTHDTGVAYKMTYPKTNNNSVYAAASRLMARPDVAEWIKETEDRVHERALREIEEENGGVLKNQLLSINQKRAVLTKIITGETKRVRHVKTKYSYQMVEDDLPIYAVLRAIDMDTRLENFYNLLSNPDTWKRTQTVYVNTPTLQQQVNVLIAQTTNKEEEKEPVQQDIPNTDASQSLAQDNTSFEQPVPLQQQADGTCPLAENNTLVQESSSIDKGKELDLLVERQSADNDTLSISPDSSHVLQKTPHYLTKLNKLKPEYPFKQTG